MRKSSAAGTGTIHGRVMNPTGQPQAGGTVGLSTDGGATLEYTFNVTNSGDYTGEAPQGTYMVVYRAPATPAGKIVDAIHGVEIIAGQDTAQDVDMSRQEYLDKMPASARKQLEDLKKQNAEALRENEIIKVLNADLLTCAQNMKDGDSAPDAETRAAKYGDCETLMLRDTQTKPDTSVLWLRLGQAQAGLMKDADAESSLKRALELESTAKYPNIRVQSLANSELDKIHARTGSVAGPNAVSSGVPPSPAPPMPDIAPPPPPADAPPPAPPTIALGQTMDQVTAVSGSRSRWPSWERRRSSTTRT